jgi:penicillin-binding protein 2
MQRYSHPGRLVLVFLAMLLVLTIYLTSLYKLQMLSGAAEKMNTISENVTMTAARGSILDRNGVVLVSSRPVYNVVISRDKLLEQEDPNKIILELLETARACGAQYTDTFPLTASSPSQYVDMTGEQSGRLEEYLDYFDLDPDISAQELIVWMKTHYGLDYTTSLADARAAIGIRYELELRPIQGIPEYIFVKDANIDLISQIAEKEFPGVSVKAGSVREYHTKSAAHILGHMALMDSDDYEVYKEYNYPMDAYVGKDGIERAFEIELHGRDGRQTILKNSEGAVIGKSVTTAPEPGKNVFLTIDINMQEIAEKALLNTITSINRAAPSEKEKARGGAVVVFDVKNSDVLTSASYPTYDLSTFSENSASLLNDESGPLFNRATQGEYNPGSTFKMVTALAGLREGIISRWTTVTDQGVYTAYGDYQPRCWIYSQTGGTHGTLDVVGALEDSCNYFFYWLGDRLGIEAITQASQDFGLGKKTGIELYEEVGNVASHEYKTEEFEEQWYAADTLITAIGQGYSMLTPLQMANYVSSIANGGTLYSRTLLKSIKSYDYKNNVLINEPEVLSTLYDDAEYLAILREGMSAVSQTGTASQIFSDYPVAVASKTGTVQSDNSSNTGVFVCFAPADDPEIAIAVVVEQGISGSTIAEVAKKILDYYFIENTESGIILENTLLP